MATMKKASSLRKQLKPLGSLSDKAVKAAAKKAAKKVDPMKASARSHQKDLAKMSGDTAATKKFQKVTKSGKIVTDKALRTASKAGNMAEKRTLKSFK